LPIDSKPQLNPETNKTQLPSKLIN